MNIKIKELNDYLEQASILVLYKKDYETKFQYELNEKIIHYYNSQNNGVQFNPDSFEVVKPKSFLIESLSKEDLETIYLDVAKKICEQLKLHLVVNPDSNYSVQENDYVLFSYDYKNIKQSSSQLEFIQYVHEHTTNLANAFKIASGGMLLFSNIEHGPYMHKSLNSLISNETYYKTSTNSVLFSFSTERSLTDIKNNILPELEDKLLSLQISDYQPSHEKHNKIKI